jgi:predicted ATPase with chaperone activity
MGEIARPRPVINEPSPGAIPGRPFRQAPFVPKSPKNFDEAGLEPSMVEALILKYLADVGSSTGSQIAAHLRLPVAPIFELLAVLKSQQLVEYAGMEQVDDYRFQLTGAGHGRARRYMFESLYVGPAPVPVDAYIEGINAQTITAISPHEQNLREAFHDLLISPEMIQALGPAINSGRGMFLYGNAGNGKTSIAERITRCFGDEIYIPRCLVVDGLIIKLFDAAIHEQIVENKTALFSEHALDERWVRIKRPTIVAGGELTMEALEVRYNPTSKICEAPLQLKSNCGTLVLDDFGRQRVKPIELLNRWMVPLEKRYDYLALPNGETLRVPFDQLIIFSTNLEPRDLCDDAFLRRIPYKINVPDPSEGEFRELFDFVGPNMGFTLDKAFHHALDYLVATHYTAKKRPFRRCQPRDLLLQVKNRCLFLGEPLSVSPHLYDLAASMYFTIM